MADVNKALLAEAEPSATSTYGTTGTGSVGIEVGVVAEDGKKGGKNMKKPKKEKPLHVTYRQLYRFADKVDYVLMFLGSFAAACNGSALPVMMYFFGNMTNIFVEFEQGLITTSSFMDRIEFYACVYVGIGGAAFLFAYCETALWMLTGERQARRIRKEYLKALLRQEISWFDQHQSGELSSRVAADTQLIQESLSEKNGNLVRVLCMFLSGFAMGFFRGWKLALVLLSVVPLLAICGGLMAKFMTTLSTRGQAAYASAGSVAEEVLSSIRTVVSFSGEKRECNRYQSLLDTAMRIGFRQALSTGLGLGVTMLIMFSSYGLGFWYGCRLILEGSYSGGHVITVFFCILIGSFALGQANPPMETIANGRGAAYKVWQTLDRPSKIDPFNIHGERLQNVRGEIEFRDVHFRYETRSDVPVLRGVTFSVRQGQTVALVGTSGCGKSTIVSLLQRFYDPTDGDILLDGTSTRSLNLKWFRRQIGFVSQEPVLFGTSIKENILYGNPEAGMREVEEAARLANAHDFIMTLPLGYDTLVGERGAQLSGGQKQRVAIARALIRNPRVLVFDEATSALDSESEKIVQAALEKASAGRTTIVIAHRLSTVRNADCIVVMRQGQVVETGRHDDLFAIEHGVYRALVHAQDFRHHRQTESSSEVVGDVDLSSASELDLADDAVLAPEAPKWVKPVEVSDEKAKKVAVAASPNEEEEEDDDEDDVVDYAENPDADASGSNGTKGLLSGKAKAIVNAKKKKRSIPMSRLAKLNRPELWAIGLGAIAAAMNGIVFPMYSLLFSQMMQTFAETGKKLQDDARFWSLMFVALGGLTFVAGLGQNFFFGIAGERLTSRIRAMTFESIVHKEVAFFDQKKHSTGRLTAKLATEAAQVKGMLGSRVGLICQMLVTAVAAMVIAFISGWELTLVILSVVPLIAIAGSLQMRTLTGYAAQAKQAYVESGQVASESLECIRTVTSFGLEDRMLERYANCLQRPYQMGRKRSHIAGLGFGFSNMCIYGTYALGFWYGGRLVSKYDMTYLRMMRVFTSIVFGAMSAGQVTQFAPEIAKGSAAAVQIFDILDRISKIDASKPAGKRPEGISGSITFRDVKFRYPSRRDAEVLRGLNFQVEAGKTLALVGSSGSGKSTVIALLERFYDTSEGEILFDNHPIRSLNLSWLRSQIALVSQEPILFAASIAENIAYGKEGATQMEIEAAARMANIHDFIASLPKGYDTLAGEKGTQLSGGQKQRIAIARALIRNPRVLLLDEATSALDSESEKVVQDALEKASKGRTTIVIAHRLSTVKDADCIAVMNKGVIVEYGRHDELIAARGEYSRLVRLQQRTLNDM